MPDLADTEVKVYRGFSEELLDSMHTLESGIFDDPWSRATLAGKCEHKHHLLGLIALVNGQPAAFKIGYEISSRLYYSWLGGVLPDMRHRGLALHLMDVQHQLAAQMGYQTVRTHTHNKFRQMLLLNIRYGFNVVGVINDRADGEPTIVLDKTLPQNKPV